MVAKGITKRLRRFFLIGITRKHAVPMANMMCDLPYNLMT